MEHLFNNDWVRWSGPKSRRHRPNWSLLVIVAVLSIIGLILQYSIGPAIAQQQGSLISDNYYFIRHGISVLIGAIAFIVAYKIPLKVWMSLTPVFLIIGIVLAVATVVAGGLGSRWLQIGFFSFQPIELLKMTVALGGGLYLSKLNKLEKFKTKSLLSIQYFLYLIAIIGFIVVLFQRDLGSMVVLTLMVGGMLWVAGTPLRTFAILGAAGIVFLSGFIGLVEYRRDRVSTFINPTADCLVDGYQTCQALIGIGSGGLFGRGIGESIQVYGYLPRANDDSIFAIYAEIFGFVGVVALLGLMAKLYQLMYSIAKHSDEDLMYTVVALLVWFSLQSAMNIGAMIGVLPLKGITLPFISYGGSSLMLVLFSAGLILQISAYTRYNNETNEDNTHRGRVRRSHYTSRRPGKAA